MPVTLKKIRKTANYKSINKGLDINDHQKIYHTSFYEDKLCSNYNLNSVFNNLQFTTTHSHLKYTLARHLKGNYC